MEEKHLTRHGRQEDGAVNFLVPSLYLFFVISSAKKKKNASQISTSTATAERWDDRIPTALTGMSPVGISLIESSYGLCFVLNFSAMLKMLLHAPRGVCCLLEEIAL
jgi:hypothetical protein